MPDFDTILLPWLAESWKRLSASIRSERIPHALLIGGPRGVGKSRLVQAYARRLLCSQPGEFACGLCHACRLIAAGSHPDLLWIGPESAGKPITVDAIRELIQALALKPHYTGRRVVVLTPAHLMNLQAANCLLKTLEEPDPRTSLVLVSEQPASLPVTLLSRCQRLHISAPSKDAALAWLRDHGVGEEAETLWHTARGSPLRALELWGTEAIGQRRELLESWVSLVGGDGYPVPVAAAWSKLACEDVITWLTGWIEDWIRWRCAPQSASADRANVQEMMRSLDAKLDLNRLFEYLDQLYGAQRSLNGQVNRQLLLEELAIHASRLARQPRRSPD